MTQERGRGRESERERKKNKKRAGVHVFLVGEATKPFGSGCEELSNGMLGFNNCLKIADVPFPLPFAQLLGLLLVAFSLLIPMHLGEETHPYPHPNGRVPCLKQTSKTISELPRLLKPQGDLSFGTSIPALAVVERPTCSYQIHFRTIFPPANWFTELGAGANPHGGLLHPVLEVGVSLTGNLHEVAALRFARKAIYFKEAAGSKIGLESGMEVDCRCESDSNQFSAGRIGHVGPHHSWPGFGEQKRAGFRIS